MPWNMSYDFIRFDNNLLNNLIKWEMIVPFAQKKKKKKKK